MIRVWHDICDWAETMRTVNLFWRALKADFRYVDPTG
jgi:hypothetical protein